MSRSRHVALSLVLLLAIGVSAGFAYDQPAVNLGLTTFLDGIPPAGPGWYVQDYVQFYTADTLMDGDGNEIPLPNPQLDVWVNLLQVIYQSDIKCPVSDGAIGINFILPFVSADLTGAGPLQAAGSGFGDLLVGPFIQWVIMGEKGPVFAHRVELQCLIPTGEYDEFAAVSPGANVFSFNPYWAGTWFLGPKASISTRIHYLWNDTNLEPIPRATGIPQESQAGQAIHANLSAAYNVHGSLRLGVNAYAFKQLDETEVDGVGEAGSKEEVIGVGPGALYSFSKDTHLFVNAYFETAAEARPEGQRYVARIVHHF